MPSTIKDVARQTGYSLATISKYINGGRVKPAYREKISAAVEALDFKPSFIAKGLRRSVSFIVGIITPALDNIFTMRIISALESELARHGYSAVICDSRNDALVERSKAAFLLSKRVDGIIIVPCSFAAAHIKEEVGGRVPVVFVDRICADFETDAVIIDNEEISFEATDELLSKTPKAALISTKDIYTADERTKGYMRAHESRSIAVNPDYIRDGRLSVEGGYNAMLALWALPDRPRALFVTNYEMTIGVVMAANSLGISLDGDIFSVTAFDNMELTKIMKPSINAVNQPMNEIGLAAAELILKRIKGGAQAAEPARKIVLNAVLVRAAAGGAK